MSVYVDEMMVCMKSEHWHYNRVCHLVADSVKELHVFAKRLGLKRSWFQSKSDLPHYDLTYGMRYKAVKLGAVEINQRMIVELMRKYRTKEAGQ